MSKSVVMYRAWDNRTRTTACSNHRELRAVLTGAKALYELHAYDAHWGHLGRDFEMEEALRNRLHLAAA